jgi:beta-lactamase class A
MTLLDKIRGPAEGFDGRAGVSVKHLGTGESASLNGDELFPTASVFKVPVIVELYRQVEAGTMSLDEKVVLREEDKVPGSGILKELSEGLELTVRDLTELMMILSDNTATDIVTERVGMENINKTLRRLGLEKTKVVADCRDILTDFSSGPTWSLGTENNDVTTPNEMLRLFEMIVDGEAAGRESCDAILSTMGRCQTGQYRLAKYLPRDKVEFAHKTGGLTGRGRSVRNDVGVVTLRQSGERYIISCFTNEAKDAYDAEEFLAKVSKNVYDYFTY